MSLFFWLFACQLTEFPAPVVGSTYRIEKDVWDAESQMNVDLLATEAECQGAQIKDLAACRPKVDRANAEVHLSFVIRDPISQQIRPTALAREQIGVKHSNSDVQTYDLIPHLPRSSGQLYIIVIDGSGSMYEAPDGGDTRIERVKKALESKSVIDSFFPEGDVGTGVVLLAFNQDLKGLDGGPPKVIKNKREYKRQIREYLTQRRGGYTHLYGAVRTAMTRLLKNKDIRIFLNERNATPTVIALTDGFNNESAADTCGDNVFRLQKTLDAVKTARAKTNPRPTLYTVGLGQRYRRGKKPEGINRPVTSSTLCGKFADVRIDGNLETEGIDHISLSWLAEAGGGRSFVRERSKDLAKAFADTAAKRYHWFEVRYNLPDPIWHRQTFETRIELHNGERAGSQLNFLPHPWLDAPTAGREGKWMKQTPIRHAFSLLMPILGGLLFLSFIGAAFFNASRALFRRARPRR